MRKSVRTVSLCVCLALAVLVFPTNARADSITPGDGWHHFSWLGGVGAFQSETPFTFTAAGATTVTVTDAYVYGDRFELYDNGVLLGTTSAINNQSSVAWTPDPDAAMSTGFSHGSYSLGAGNHSLVLKTIQVAPGYTSGAGYLRVVNGGENGGTGSVASVPEPGTLALAGLGVVGLLSRRVRRRLSRIVQPTVA